MYSKILVPVDNSPYSDICADIAIALAQACHASITGYHVFAAQLHQERFREMEPTLPPHFRQESKLQQQRAIHKSLIYKGLEMISYSYLEPLGKRCQVAGVPFQPKVAEGKNYVEIVRETSEVDYDLVVMGAQGLGAREDSQLGSVCERVVRRIRKDVLVVKGGPFLAGKVTSAVDGSRSALIACQTAAYLAQIFNTPLELLSVYDPDFHRMAFHSMAAVLSSGARHLFPLDSQGKLHDETIDGGLAQIYKGYLEAAQRQVEGDGLAVHATLLAGKPSSQILHNIRQSQASLLVLGRFGRHYNPDLDIGSTTENLLRQAPCHVIITDRPLD